MIGERYNARTYAQDHARMDFAVSPCVSVDPCLEASCGVEIGITCMWIYPALL